MWTTLNDPEMGWLKTKFVSLKWQISSITRQIKKTGSIKEGIKKWWHLRQICKGVNKSLLKKVKEMQNNGINKD
jgi:hypothetical protein